VQVFAGFSMGFTQKPGEFFGYYSGVWALGFFFWYSAVIAGQ